MMESINKNSRYRREPSRENSFVTGTEQEESVRDSECICICWPRRQHRQRTRLSQRIDTDYCDDQNLMNHVTHRNGLCVCCYNLQHTQCHHTMTAPPPPCLNTDSILQHTALVQFVDFGQFSFSSVAAVWNTKHCSPFHQKKAQKFGFFQIEND